MTRLSVAAAVGWMIASHAVACRSSPSVNTARHEGESATASSASGITLGDTASYDEVSAGASFPPSPPSFSEPALLYMGARRHGDAIRAVLTTRADVERVWRDAWSNWRGTPPRAPSMDFTREMVIVAAVGAHSGAARRVGVTRVTDRNNVLTIAVEIQMVDPKCDSFARTHYPIVMVTVPATSSTPVFEDRVVQVRC